MQQNDYTDAAAIDLVELLASLGHTPQKINGQDYWYCSPLRDEKTASFKVNRTKNVFYDHGTGTGGSPVRFVMLYHRCTAKQAIRKILQGVSLISLQEKKSVTAVRSQPGTIQILEVQPLTAPALLQYLQQRCIPVDLAMKYCVQVQYRLKDKTYYAIGFKNDGGGYELRNKYFKGSSSPKGPRLLEQQASRLIVFEGFFNLLSYLTLQKDLLLPEGSYLVLNSLSFFGPAKSIMEQYPAVLLCLDRDAAGMHCTATAIKSDKRFKDASQHYAQDKDWNQWLVLQETGQKLTQKTPAPILKKHHRRHL